MRDVCDLITISELARLINISRPTLYKYIEDYKMCNYGKISFELVKLFDFICDASTTNKIQIYDYCNNRYQICDEKGILDRIKIYLIKDNKYKKYFLKILKEIENIDIDELLQKE